jgi:hypothetical protein
MVTTIPHSPVGRRLANHRHRRVCPGTFLCLRLAILPVSVSSSSVVAARSQVCRADDDKAGLNRLGSRKNRHRRSTYLESPFLVSYSPGGGLCYPGVMMQLALLQSSAGCNSKLVRLLLAPRVKEKRGPAWHQQWARHARGGAAVDGATRSPSTKKRKIRHLVTWLLRAIDKRQQSTLRFIRVLGVCVLKGA